MDNQLERTAIAQTSSEIISLTRDQESGGMFTVAGGSGVSISDSSLMTIRSDVEPHGGSSNVCFPQVSLY